MGAGLSQGLKRHYNTKMVRVTLEVQEITAAYLMTDIRYSARVGEKSCSIAMLEMKSKGAQRPHLRLEVSLGFT